MECGVEVAIRTGINVLISLKVTMQVDWEENTLAFTIQCIEHRSWVILLQLDKMFVRPYLENCVLFWFPTIGRMSSIWKGCRRMLPEVAGYSYKRLDRLGRFPRGDLVELYKTVRDKLSE